MFPAVLDTCVLWPSLHRDFLLTLGTHHVFEPRWSEDILAELEIHETEKLVSHGVSESNAQHQAFRLIRQMETHFPQCTVHVPPAWSPAIPLPDPYDEHVLGAAVFSNAEVIVTNNLKDFPRNCLPSGISAIPPSEFLADAVGLSPTRGLEACNSLLARLKNPALTLEQFITKMEERYGATEAATMLRDAARNN